jgi:hypothetical protein
MENFGDKSVKELHTTITTVRTMQALDILTMKSLMLSYPQNLTSLGFLMSLLACGNLQFHNLKMAGHMSGMKSHYSG